MSSVKDMNRDYLEKRLQDIFPTAVTENKNTCHYPFFIQTWRKSNPETQWTPGARNRNPNKGRERANSSDRLGHSL